MTAFNVVEKLSFNMFIRIHFMETFVTSINRIRRWLKPLNLRPFDVFPTGLLDKLTIAAEYLWKEKGLCGSNFMRSKEINNAVQLRVAKRPKNPHSMQKKLVVSTGQRHIQFKREEQ